MHRGRPWLAALITSLVLAPIPLSATAAVIAPNPRFVTHGPWGGPIAGLAVDQTDGDIVFAADDDVVRSADGGRSWKVVLDVKSFFSTVAIAPSGHQTVYAGGYPDVYASEDGGFTWTDRSFGLGTRGAVETIVVDPIDPKRVYVGKEGGRAHRTVDGGLTWATMPDLSSNYVNDIAIAPSLPTTLYAGTYAGLFVSVDSGDSWRRTTLSDEGLAIAVDPVDSLVLYVATYVGVYRSGDGGLTWSLLGSQLADGEPTDVVVDPTDRNVLYVALSEGGGAVSTDGGASWSKLRLEGGGRVIALGPDPGNLFAGTTFGVYRSDDEGHTWRLTSRGIAHVDVGRVVMAPSDPTRLYAATSGGTGVFRSNDAGRTWDPARRGLGTGDVTDVAVAPDDPDVAFAVTVEVVPPKTQLYRTGDSGAHWQPTSRGIDISELTFVAIDPTDSSIVYAVDLFHGLYRSLDQGTSWTAIPIPGVDQFFYVVIDPTDGQTLYVGNPDGVQRSKDGGATWTEIFGRGYTGLVVVDPMAPTVIYMVAGVIYRSVDDGATWTRLLNGLDNASIACMALDPADPETIYAGTHDYPTLDRGLFRSTNRGGAFRPFSRGLPDAAVSGIVVSPDSRAVFVAMDENGIYQLEFP